MRRWLNLLYDAAGLLAAAALAGICLLVSAQITLRLLDNASWWLLSRRQGLMIPSVAEMAGFLLVAATFLALAHAFRHGAHIRVNLLLSRLPGAMRRLAELFGLALAAGLTLFFSWHTALMVLDSWRFGEVSYGIVAIPLWLPQSFMLLGLVIFAIALLDDLLVMLAGGTPSWERAAQRAADDVMQVE